MADWSHANGSSGAASSSSGRDLVSPLTIKLQQVWLQSQFRPPRDVNEADVGVVALPSPGGAVPVGSGSGSAGNPGISGNFATPLASPAMAGVATPSSSSESGDDSWGSVVARRGEGWGCQSGTDKDAVLQYIDKVLMEDQVEQQACLDLELGAFTAELAELIQTSPPPQQPVISQVSTNPEWRTDLSGKAQCSSSPPAHYPPQPSSSSSRRNSPTSSWNPSSPSSSSLPAQQNGHQERSFQRSSSMKKRSHRETGSGDFQMVSRVGFFERQNLFGLDGRSVAAAAAAAIAASRSQSQTFLPRPPKLILQRTESYTWLWDKLGLKSQLLDKLVFCGELVSSHDFEVAMKIADELSSEAAVEGDATQRVVHYFVQALLARMGNTGVHFYSAMCKARPSIAETFKAVQMIVKHTPFLSLPHFFTNKIILEAIKGARKVHIIDFGIMYGLQWPALLQLLAERKEGPPQLRMTGVDLPPKALTTTHVGRIRETGGRLNRCAHDWGIPFKFRSLSCPWEAIEPGLLQLRDDEVLIISCSFKQTNLFDESVIAESPKFQWLKKVRNLNPKVFIQALASSDFGGPIFLKRFQMSLVHHAAVFAAMDACISRMLPERRVIEQDKYGREIMNIIACDSVDRVERSESHQQWHHRTEKAGFEIMPLSQDLFEESQEFAQRYNRDLTVDRNGEWMWLGWKNQIIHAYSAWRVAMNEKSRT